MNPAATLSAIRRALLASTPSQRLPSQHELRESGGFRDTKKDPARRALPALLDGCWSAVAAADSPTSESASTGPAPAALAIPSLGRQVAGQRAGAVRLGLEVAHNEARANTYTHQKKKARAPPTHTHTAAQSVCVCEREIERLRARAHLRCERRRTPALPRLPGRHQAGRRSDPVVGRVWGHPGQR